jgi:hypothetical protein
MTNGGSKVDARMAHRGLFIPRRVRGIDADEFARKLYYLDTIDRCDVR